MLSSDPARLVAAVAFGVLGGFAGALAITTSKVCWLVIDSLSLRALSLGLWWVYALLSLLTEVLMVIAVFNGMALHEASVVVSTYYVSMTLFGTLQGCGAPRPPRTTRRTMEAAPPAPLHHAPLL